MRDKKRPKLPRGLRWKPDSPYIWFSWRDERGRQHQQSTNTADSDEAMVYRIRFLRENQGRVAERRVAALDQSQLPLAKAAELFPSAPVSPGSSPRPAASALQLRVLLLQILQPPRLVHLQATVLFPPPIRLLGEQKCSGDAF